ncbi:ABC transporter permease [Kytococcus sp. Marseille-QA3725]
MSTLPQPPAQGPSTDDTTPHLTGPGLPFPCLFHVELRKTVDTRAGRWLLGVVVLVTALTMGLVMWFSRQDGASLGSLFNTITIPQSVLLPVLGILTMASEWSQRTALVTFTHEPRRWRVMIAKVLASVALGLLVLAVTVGLAVLAHVASTALAGSTMDLSLPAAVYGKFIVTQVLNVLIGTALGALLLNVPLAIAAFFVLPAVITVASTTVGWIRDHAAWIDLATATTPLASGSTWPTGEQWLQLASVTALWVALPLALGLWRVARKEVK